MDRAIWDSTPTATVVTDASMEGWDAVVHNSHHDTGTQPPVALSAPFRGLFIPNEAEPRSINQKNPWPPISTSKVSRQLPEMLTRKLSPTVTFAVKELDKSISANDGASSNPPQALRVQRHFPRLAVHSKCLISGQTACRRDASDCCSPQPRSPIFEDISKIRSRQKSSLAGKLPFLDSVAFNNRLE
jgi:hypothetical protein